MEKKVKIATTSPSCPECGGKMIRDTRPFTVTYKGVSAVVDAPGWYCVNGDEAVFVGKDMDAADKALVKLKAQAEHLLTPEEVRKIRKKLSLTQDEAGELLGGGPNAFHKYESSQLNMSRALSNLLRVLDAEPGMLNVVRETGGRYSATRGEKD